MCWVTEMIQICQYPIEKLSYYRAGASIFRYETHSHMHEDT